MMKPKKIIGDFSEKMHGMLNNDSEEIINKKQSLILLGGVGVLIIALIMTFMFLFFNGSETRGELNPSPAADSRNNSKDSIAVTVSEKKAEDNSEYGKYGPLASEVIELRIGDNTEKLDIKRIADFVDVTKKTDGSFSYKLKNDKLTQYASELASEYNTFTSSVEFVNHAGEKIELQNNSFGWILDESYTSEKLGELILGKKSVTVNLTNRSNESDKWWMRIAGAYGPCDTYGNSYAEVSIDIQYMWVYKDGKIVLEGNVVTGNPNTGNDTPKGEFRITNKAKNATLYGIGYNTQVAYWMAFADDIGFHDAEWQESFGGDVYQENGSHGCVNLPTDIAGSLYSIVYIDMPVFVY